MRSIAELQELAWRAIVRELGLADALRFRILFQPGAGDDAADRELLVAAMAAEDWAREMEAYELRRAKSSEGSPGDG